jgi:hypothetical protein
VLSLVRNEKVVLAAVAVLAGLYLFYLHDRGWIPHDEGTLSHAAERVLQGELPHRDFDNPYTGGLALLHALALRLGGFELKSIRLMLLAVSLPFVVVVFLIARRAASPPWAGFVTLLALSWSMPNYFAALPSWYNLILATVGVYCLLRHLEGDRKRWLFFAGLCGGLSCCIKVTGMYFAGAALLFLLYREQVTAERAGSRRSRLHLALLCLALAVFLAGAGAIILRRPTAADLILFLVPIIAVTTPLLYNEVRLIRVGGVSGWWRLLRLLLPFVGGLVLPILGLVVIYHLGSGLRLLYEGLFVLPQERFAWAGFALRPAVLLVAGVPLVFVLAAPLFTARWSNENRSALLLGVVLVPALLLGGQPLTRLLVFSAARAVVPAVAIIGALVVIGRWGAGLDPRRRQQVVLLVSMAVLLNLTQIPHSYEIYFLYCAPLVILAVLFVVSAQPAAPRRLHLCLAAFFLLYPAVWLHADFLWTERVVGAAKGRLRHFDIPRAKLWVPAHEEAAYRRLVAEVARHAPAGSTIYAAPDCPEVFFLTGTKNATRTFYDFFDRDFKAPGDVRTARILAALQQKEVNVVVLKDRGEFSGVVAGPLRAALARRFPHRRRIDHFVVRWRGH